jgi:hypothetical protein
LKEKVAADVRYVILGACNPRMAHQVRQAEDKVGTMLPCNVVVQTVGGRTEVAAIVPAASMQAIGNDKLAAVANKVRLEPCAGSAYPDRRFTEQPGIGSVYYRRRRRDIAKKVWLRLLSRLKALVIRLKITGERYQL